MYQYNCFRCNQRGYIINIEKHLANLKESTDVIHECIQRGNLVERQRTIGFHTSVASVDLLEIYLHKEKLIDPGMQLKHDWFASKNKIESKLPFEFHNKDKILNIMFGIENKRNLLCYGAPQKKEIVIEVITIFQELKNILKSMGVDYE